LRVSPPRRSREHDLVKRLIAAATLAATRTALAGGGPPTDAYDGIGDAAIDVHVLADVYVAGNFDDPKRGQSQLRAFDTTANLPALGWLRVRIAHKPRVRFGFRVDLGIGDTANAYLAGDPARVAYPGWSRWLSYVGQAFVTAAVTRCLSIDAGKFDTPLGLEDNEGLDNWNYSRSLIFTWDEPSLHTGVRATYVVSPELAVAAFWLNGWDANVVGGTDMRSYAATARWKPTDAIEVVAVYAGGLERGLVDPATLAIRNTLDAYVTYSITKSLALAASGDVAIDQFEGAAAYARYAALDWLAGAVRAERFGDPRGLSTGTPQALDEVTATLEGRGVVRGVTMVGRLEYRHDWSNAEVFDHAGALERTQQTLTLSLIASR
jgi:hypothetical protein